MNIPNTFLHWLQESWIYHTKLQILYYLYYPIVTFIIHFYLKYLNIFRGEQKYKRRVDFLYSPIKIHYKIRHKY